MKTFNPTKNPLFMKTKIWIYSLAILAVSLMITSGCKKKDDNNNSTLIPTTVADIDGKVYHTKIIGAQVWLIENLNVTHYRNGDPIPNVTDRAAWHSLTTGAYCNYDNNENISTTYGRLYNWYAVHDSRGICPQGWHVATMADDTILINYLGGGEIAGGKMRATSGWDNGLNGTNSSGFSALPGGTRWQLPDFNGLGAVADFWTSTEGYSNLTAYKMGMYPAYPEQVDIYGDYPKSAGFSVRCVMN